MVDQSQPNVDDSIESCCQVSKSTHASLISDKPNKRRAACPTDDQRQQRVVVVSRHSQLTSEYTHRVESVSFFQKVCYKVCSSMSLFYEMFGGSRRKLSTFRELLTSPFYSSGGIFEKCATQDAVAGRFEETRDRRENEPARVPLNLRGNVIPIDFCRNT